MKIGAYILFLSSLLFAACSQRGAEKWLSLAEGYSERNPDSTLFYLGKIKHPENLPGKQWACYQLYHTKAGMWKGQKQETDSLILKAAGLFVQERDSGRAADAFYRAALIHYYQGGHGEADSLILSGLQFAVIPKIRVLLYGIGGSNYSRLSKSREALSYHRKALEDLSLVPANWQPYLLANVGQAFAHLEQVDSAVCYYKHVIRVSEELERDGFVSFYYLEISKIYREAGDYEKAVEALKASLSFKDTRQAIPLNMLAHAKIFLAMEEKDSATLYLQKAIQSPDPYIATAAYQFLAEMHEPLKRDSVTFRQWETFQNSFANVKSELDAEIMRKKFQDEQLRNENNELKLKQKQTDIYLLSLSLILVIVCTLAYIIYMRERKRKEIAGLEQERKLIALRERTTALREQLFRKLSVSQKIPSLSGKRKEEANDFNSRLTPEDIEELMQTVDSIWPGFASKLQNTYPALKPKDITFCCLLKSGISVKDLAAILYVTPSAISQKKARMKREKLGVHDDAVSLDDILRDF